MKLLFNKKVQRMRKVLKIDGPSGRGFLSLMGHRPKGCGGALRAQFIPFLQRPDRFARKTVQPRLRRDGNAPLLSPAATSPPEGEILAALIFEFLMRTKDEWQEDFPLRGKWCVSTKRGAFPRAKPGCTVFPAAKGGFKNSPLNQPALWAEPMVRREAHEP